MTDISKLTLTTTAFKGRDGWEAETIIPLDRGGEEGWRLSITTHKASRGGIYTSAGVHRVNGGFLTTRIFRDFRQTVVNEPNKRCTEKNIKELHERCITQHLTAILNAELAWEAEQVRKEQADRARIAA